MKPNIREAIDAAISLFESSYAHRWKSTPGAAAAWHMVLGDCDPTEVIEAALTWCRTGNEWPPTAPQLRAALPSMCHCGQLSCALCRKRRVEAITRGPTKRIYGDGGAFAPAPTSLNGMSAAQLTEGDDE